MKIKPLKLWQITVIIISIIVLAIGGCFLGVYLTRGFGKKDIPPEKINIEDIDNCYNNRTGQYEVVDTFKIKITSPTEQVNMSELRFRFDSNVTVERNTNGEITDGVIIVKEYANLGDEIEISLKQKLYTASDGTEVVSNAGGISKLYIETKNNLYALEEITIAVDVPVEKIDFKLCDSSSATEIRELDGTEVAENSMFIIKPEFFPAESEYLFSDNLRDATRPRKKEVFFQMSLASPDGVSHVYGGGEDYFIAGEHVSDGNVINGYVFKKGTDQNKLYESLFASFEQEIGDGDYFGKDVFSTTLYDEAVSTLSNDKDGNVCAPSVNVSVIEATIGSFTVKPDASFSMRTNKMFTLYAGMPPIGSGVGSDLDSDWLCVDVRDDKGESHSELIKNVGIRLKGIYLKTDTRKANNLLGDDYLGQSGQVRVTGGEIRNVLTGEDKEGVAKTEKYLLINSDVRYYDYAKWEISSEGDYVIDAEVVLIWQNEKEQYEFYMDEKENKVVSYPITFTSTESLENEKDISWQNVGGSLTTTLVYDKDSIVPSQINLARLYNVPAENIYQKVVFFAYLEGAGDIHDYIDNLDTVGEGNYGAAISGAATLYPIRQGSELMVKSPGTFKLLFATVKTDAYRKPLMSGNMYQIVKYVAPIDVIVNKTLREPTRTFRVDNEEYLNNKDYVNTYVIPTNKSEVIVLNITLQPGDGPVFETEKSRIKFYASEEEDGSTEDNPVFKFGEPQLDSENGTVTVLVSVNNVAISEQKGRTFFFFMRYDNSFTIQRWRITPEDSQISQQVRVYEQKAGSIATVSGNLEDNTFTVSQELDPYGAGNNVSITDAKEVGITTLDALNNEFKEENIVIKDIFGKVIEGAQYHLENQSTNASGQKVLNITGHELSFNNSEGRVAVSVAVVPNNPLIKVNENDEVCNPLEFTLDVETTGVSKISVDEVDHTDNLSNIRTQTEGKAGESWQPSSHFKIYVKQGAEDVLYEGPIQVYLASSFVQSTNQDETRRDNIWSMLKINDYTYSEGQYHNIGGEGLENPLDEVEISSLGFAQNFGKNLEVMLNVRNEDGTINFIITLNILSSITDGTNTLGDVQYEGVGAGVPEEDRPQTEQANAVFVYAGYEIKLDDYLKVMQGGVILQDFWAKEYESKTAKLVDVSSGDGTAVGEIKQGGVLYFYDVYRPQEATITLYAIDGNDYAYTRQISVVICPNFKIEVIKATAEGANKTFAMTDLTKDSQNNLNMNAYINILRKTKNADSESPLPKFGGWVIGSAADGTDYIKADINGVISFNKTLSLGYGEKFKVVTIWLKDYKGDNSEGEKIEGVSCSLNFEIGIDNKSLIKDTNNSWLGDENQILYNGTKLIFVEQTAEYHISEVDGLKVQIGGSTTGAYEVTSTLDPNVRNINFKPSGQAGYLVGTTKYLNFVYTLSENDDLMYARKEEPIFISFVGKGFASYITEKDFKDYFADTVTDGQCDLAELLAASTSSELAASVKGGGKYFFYSPDTIDGKNVEFTEDGKLKLGEDKAEYAEDVQLLNQQSGTIKGVKFTAVRRVGFGWRLTSYGENIYLSALKYSDANDDAHKTYYTNISLSSEWSGLFKDATINSKTGEFTLNNVVSTDPIKAYITVKMTMSGVYSTEYQYRLIITPNATLQPPVYPYDGEVESLTIAAGASQEIDMSAPIGNDLHKDEKRFPDAIYIGESKVPTPITETGTLSVSMIKHAEEDITSSYRNNVQITGSVVKISNPDNFKDLVVVIQKTYPNVFGAIATYTFLINSSNELQYYLEFAAGTEEIEEEVELERNTEKIITVTPWYRDKNTGMEGVLNDAVITARFNSDMLKGSTVKEDEEGDVEYSNTVVLKNNTLTLTPADFVPAETKVTITFSVSYNGKLQDNISPLTVVIPSTVEIKQKTTLDNINGGKTYQATDFADIIDSSDYSFTAISVESVTKGNANHQGVSVTNEDKFYKVEGASITFHHTIKPYKIVLKLTYAHGENVGYFTTSEITVNQSLTFEDNLSLNDVITRDTSDTTKTIYGGIAANVEQSKIFTNISPEGGKEGNITGFSIARAVNFNSTPTYSENEGAYNLNFTLNDVKEEQTVNSEVTFKYTAAEGYGFEVTVRFAAVVSPRATIQANYPTISGGDYESIASGSTFKWKNAPFGAKKEEETQLKRITGTIRTSHNGNTSPSEAINYSAFTVTVETSDNVTQSSTTDGITLTLTDTTKPGKIVFNINYCGATTSYEFNVVSKLISAYANKTIDATSSSVTDGATSISETLYEDKVKDDATLITDSHRLLEINVTSAAVSDIVYEIWLVYTESEVQKEVRLTDFLMSGSYRNNTIYVDWGAKQEVSDELEKVFTTQENRIEFRSRQGNVLQGAIATRLAGRIEFTYATHSGGTRISDGIQITAGDWGTASVDSGAKKGEFTVSGIQYEVNGAKEDTNISFTFKREVDIAVLREFSDSQQNFITIVTNYLYLSNGEFRYSFINTAGVVRKSTGETLTKDYIKDNSINITLNVVSVGNDTNNEYNRKLPIVNGRQKTFKNKTTDNKEYMSFRNITYASNDTTICDFVVFGEGCANDGDYVLTRFTYQIGNDGRIYEALVAFYLVPGYQVTVAGTQIVGASVNKTQPSSNEVNGVTTNLNNIYSFTPTGENNNKPDNKLTLVSKTGENNPILSVKRPLWNDSEIAQAFDQIYFTVNDGVYNKQGTLDKLWKNGNESSGWKEDDSKYIPTTSGADARTELHFDTIKVIFGEKLYKIVFEDSFHYKIELYFKLLPEEKQNPSLSNLSNSSFVEGEKFDVGAIFTRIAPPQEEEKEYSVTANQTPAPENSQIKKFVVQGVNAWGFTSPVALNDKENACTNGKLDATFKNPPTLHDVTIEDIEFNYFSAGGSVSAKAIQNTVPKITFAEGAGSGTDRRLGKKWHGFTISELTTNSVTLKYSVPVALTSAEKTFTGEFKYNEQDFTVTTDENKQITSIKSKNQISNGIVSLYQGTALTENSHFFLGSSKEDNNYGFFTWKVDGDILSFDFEIGCKQTTSETKVKVYPSTAPAGAGETTVTFGSDNSDLSRSLATDDLYYPISKDNDGSGEYRPLDNNWIVPTMPGWIYGTNNTVSATVTITLHYKHTNAETRSTEEETATLAPISITLSRNARTSSKNNVVIDSVAFNLDNYIGTSAQIGKLYEGIEYFDDTLSVTVPDKSTVTVKVELSETEHNSFSEAAEGGTTQNEVTETPPQGSWDAKSEKEITNTSSICQTYYTAGAYDMSLSDMQRRAITPNSIIKITVESTKEGAMIAYGGVWFKVDQKVGDGDDAKYVLGSRSERIVATAENAKSSSTVLDTAQPSTGDKDLGGMSKPYMPNSGQDNGKLIFSPKAITKDVLYIENSGILNSSALSTIVTKSYVVRMGVNDGDANTKDYATYYQHSHTFNVARYISFFDSGLGTDTMLRLYVKQLSGESPQDVTTTKDVEGNVYENYVKWDSGNGYSIDIKEWGKKAELYQTKCEKTVVKNPGTKQTLAAATDDNFLKALYFEVGESDSSLAHFDDDGRTLITGANYKPSNEEHILIRIFLKSSGGPFDNFAEKSSSDFELGHFMIILYNQPASS